MKKHYKKFYRNSNLNNQGDQPDIDEIMDTYLMPIQELQKKQNLSTYWQTMNKTNSPDNSLFIHSFQLNESVQTKNVFNLQINQNQEKNQPQDNGQLAQTSNPGCQTLNLNNYFHQQISNFLKKLQALKYLDENDNKICQNYYMLSKTFSSHLQLCNSEKIKKYCLQYFTSSQFVKRLLLSSKMNFRRKKHILKYTNKISQIFSSKTQLKNWKR